jgi:hypothetical protein
VWCRSTVWVKASRSIAIMVAPNHAWLIANDLLGRRRRPGSRPVPMRSSTGRGPGGGRRGRRVGRCGCPWPERCSGSRQAVRSGRAARPEAGARGARSSVCRPGRQPTLTRVAARDLRVRGLFERTRVARRVDRGRLARSGPRPSPHRSTSRWCSCNFRCVTWPPRTAPWLDRGRPSCARCSAVGLSLRLSAVHASQNRAEPPSPSPD